MYRHPLVRKIDSPLKCLLSSSDKLNNFTPSYSTSFYNYISDYWNITPNDFTLNNSANIQLSNEYSIHLEFKLTSISSNLVIFSNWSDFTKQNFYISYNASTNSLLINYLTNTLTTLSIYTYANSIQTLEKTYISLEYKNNKLSIFVNGVKTSELTRNFNLLSKQFRFNYNILNTMNNSQSLQLHKFIVFNKQHFVTNYTPPINTAGIKLYNPISSIPIQSRVRKTARVKYSLDYDISLVKLDSSLAESNSLVVSKDIVNSFRLKSKRAFSNLIKFKLVYIKDKHNEILSSNLTLPTDVDLLQNTNAIDFDIELATLEKQVNNKLFIKLYSNDFSKIIEFNIANDVFDLLTELQVLSNYKFIDGFIPSLTTSLQNYSYTNNTSITSVNNTQAFTFSTSNQNIQFDILSNIKTAIVLYKELISTPNRVYIGNTNAATFNGSTDYKLIGSTIDNTSTLNTVITKTNQYYPVALSKQDNTLIAFNNTTNKIEIYSKENNIWPTSPLEAPTSPAVLNNDSVYININSQGSVFVIGIRDDFTGQGSIQLFRKTGDSWIRELYLNSPNPINNTGGFGYSTCINEDGTVLYVSEIGSSKIYVYRKESNWSNVPSQVISGVVGYKLTTNITGDYLFNLNNITKQLSIYRFVSNTYNVIATINDVTSYEFTNTYSNNALDSDLYFITSDVFNSIVRLNKLNVVNNQITDIKTFESNLSTYGYSVSLSSNKTIAFSNSDNSSYEVRRYKANDNYINAEVFSDAAIDYGYQISISDKSIAITNYSNIFKLITESSNQTLSVIDSVRKNQLGTSFNDLLTSDEINLLTFNSNIGFNANYIGNISNLNLNGLIYGVFMFNQVLSDDEIARIETIILKYLQLRQYTLT